MNSTVKRARETLARLVGCEERFARDAEIRELTERALESRNKRAPRLIYKTFWNPPLSHVKDE